MTHPYLPAVVLPPADGKKCRAVAMVHVHSTTALLCHNLTCAMDVAVPSAADTAAIDRMVAATLEPALAQLLRAHGSLAAVLAPPARTCRTLVRLAPLLPHDARAGVQRALHEFAAMPFVAALRARALDEVRVFVAGGVDCIEIENIAAPYFVGAGSAPWEELLIQYTVAVAVRAAFPTLAMGVHLLSCNELETLPIALATGAFFVRSEATLFAGVRPEGRVQNDGNLARFLYLRRVLRQLCDADGGNSASPADASTAASAARMMQFPQIWSDLHKKHTVFDGALDGLRPWLENIGFAKLEGVIITGDHTGSNVNIAHLTDARKAIDEYLAFVADRIVPHAAGNVRSVADLVAPGAPLLPLVTGSGSDFAAYAKLADFIIVGTALKHGGFWENKVDAAAVPRVLQAIAAGCAQR